MEASILKLEDIANIEVIECNEVYDLTVEHNHNYYLDSLPTTDYLKSFYSQSYSIKQYLPIRTFNDVEVYPKLKNNLSIIFYTYFIYLI